MADIVGERLVFLSFSLLGLTLRTQEREREDVFAPHTTSSLSRHFGLSFSYQWRDRKVVCAPSSLTVHRPFLLAVERLEGARPRVHSLSWSMWAVESLGFLGSHCDPTAPKDKKEELGPES